MASARTHCSGKPIHDSRSLLKPHTTPMLSATSSISKKTRRTDCDEEALQLGFLHSEARNLFGVRLRQLTSIKDTELCMQNRLIKLVVNVKLLYARISPCVRDAVHNSGGLEAAAASGANNGHRA